MADWQGSTPGNTPGYGSSGQGQPAWNTERRDQSPAPWPQQQSAQPSTPRPSPYPQHQQHQQQQATAGATHGSPVEQVREKAQHLASDARQQVGQRVESGLDRGKARAADTLGGVAQTLLQSSHQLREQQPQLGDYAERAAHEMQRFSDYLQRADVNELVDRAEDVARRQPALFLGGMFALGLIGARFLRSSRRAQQPASMGHRGPSLYAGSADRAYGADYGSQYGSQYGASSAPAYGSASPSSTRYADAYDGGQGSSPYGDGADRYGSTSASTHDAGHRPLDRDVTDRQRVASEPPYGASPGGTSQGYGAHLGVPGIGQESYRRSEPSPDALPDERTQPGGTPRAADTGYRTGGTDPRGGGQP